MLVYQRVTGIRFGDPEFRAMPKKGLYLMLKKHMVLSVKKTGTKLPSYLGQTVLFPRVDS